MFTWIGLWTLRWGITVLSSFWISCENKLRTSRLIPVGISFWAWSWRVARTSFCRINSTHGPWLRLKLKCRFINLTAKTYVIILRSRPDRWHARARSICMTYSRTGNISVFPARSNQRTSKTYVIGIRRDFVIFDHVYHLSNVNWDFSIIYIGQIGNCMMG